MHSLSPSYDYDEAGGFLLRFDSLFDARQYRGVLMPQDAISWRDGSSIRNPDLIFFHFRIGFPWVFCGIPT